MPTANKSTTVRPSFQLSRRTGRGTLIQRTILALALLSSSLAWSQAASSEQVQALREQARAAYPEAFVDRDLWEITIAEAQVLVAENPQNLEALRLTAEIYTETKWWILAWQAWQDYRRLGGDWDEAARNQAALAARSLVFYARQRGDSAEAQVWQQQAEALGE
jgi:hypothetical protein